MKTGQQKPVIEEEFMIFFYTKHIETMMKENEISGNDGVRD